MPSVAMSSSRPTNGLTYVAPTLAASSACVAEKISVTLTRCAFARQRLARLDAVPRERHLDDDVLVDARRDRGLRGSCPAASVATTSALTGPFTSWQICLRIARGVAALLRQQRRIGRDAVDDAERHERFDFLEIAGVDEDLHVLLLDRLLPVRGRGVEAPPSLPPHGRSTYGSVATSMATASCGPAHSYARIDGRSARRRCRSESTATMA